MDYQIPIVEHTPKIKATPANILELTDAFKMRVANDINAVVNNKRKLYEESKDNARCTTSRV